MTLLNGDLTTPQQYVEWIGDGSDAALPAIAQSISSMSRMILNKLNRARLYSQQYVRTIDGVGTYQILLPDYPVTSIVSIQMGAANIPPALLPSAPPNFSLPGMNVGYGYRFVPWRGDLPGSPPILEFVNGVWAYGAQNIRATYNAGYLVSNEAGVVPALTPWQVTVQQPQGLWCRDNGVTYANTGSPLTPVASSPGTGQYVPPTDAAPGTYTFSAGDADAALLFSYSFVPSDLTEACNQMVAERQSYKGRIGALSKSLGGQETVRWARGSRGSMWPDLPPEVSGLMLPYYSVVPPGDLGGPL